MHDLQPRQLLSNAHGAVPVADVPLRPARARVRSGAARRRRAARAGPEKGEDGRLRARQDGHGGSHVARQVGLEAELVDVARVAGLALRLLHDTVVEEMRRRAQQAVRARRPQRIAAQALHDRAAVEEDPDVVAPLVVVHLRALQRVVRPVVHGPGVPVDEVHAAAPQEDLRGPVGVLLVAGRAEEAGAELEEQGV